LRIKYPKKTTSFLIISITHDQTNHSISFQAVHVTKITSKLQEETFLPLDLQE